MTENSGPKLTLPYQSWKTLTAFIGKLKQTAIPPRIDNSVMVGMSGSARSETRTSLRFLKLVDSSDVVQPTLRHLVEAFGTDRWGDTVSDMVFAAYNTVLGQDIEWIENGTAQQLREQFRSASGMDGYTLEKAIRFFLAALDDAGSSYSPHFVARGTVSSQRSAPRRSAGKTKGQKLKLGDPGNGSDGFIASQEQKLDQGTKRLPFFLPNGQMAYVTIPDDVTEADWHMIDTYVRGYLKSGPKKA